MTTAVILLILLVREASSKGTFCPSFSRKAYFEEQKDTTLIARTVALRGGELSVPDPKTLGKVYSLLTASDALFGTFAPVYSVKLMGWQIEEKSLGSFFVSTMGAVAAALTVSNYLALSGVTSLEEAIAYGNIMRLVFLGRMLATNRLKDLGLDVTLFSVVGFSVLGSSYSLFSRKWKPLLSASLISVLLGLVGSLLYVCPVDHMNAVHGVDLVIEGKTTQELCRMAGAYTLLGALHAGLLSHRVDPAKASGYTSLATIALFYPLVGAIEVKSFLGVSKSLWLFVICCVLGGIAAGTLL